MTLWILDTDTFSLFQRGYPILTERVSVIATEHSQELLVFAYIQLRETLEDFKTIQVLNFHQEAANCYTELIRQKVRIGT